MEIKAIGQEIKKLNNGLDGISDKLVLALEKYQREYERLIMKYKFDLDENGYLKRTSANFNKISKITPMDNLGFNQLAITHIKQYNDVAEMQATFNKIIGIKIDLDYKDVTILKHYKNFDLANMYGEAAQLDNLIKKQLINAVFLNRSWHDTVLALATDLLGADIKDGRLSRYAETYMRTSLFGLSRIIDKKIYDKQNITNFVFLGALDGRTRPFCKAHVGNKYAREEIEQFPVENGSGLDPFFAPGGWNCRHRLIPVDIID